ncbi:hypothetical protein ASA1KI_21280 [Opitutales bacterium ASA1]|uniref:hypothetical protein n=1 Tax=Congregicoccus parvus TaxID=3081749 RepID=UPI002B2DECD2|nr:hypothetical protein ASA1KI_21280 [Opitutales bacterium ASA1]
MLAEYGWTIRYAMRRPLAQVFALYAAICVRYGREFSGPSYAEQDLLATADPSALPIVFEAGSMEEAMSKVRCEM